MKYTRVLKYVKSKVMSGDDIKYMQQKLTKLRYSIGKNDAYGKFGSGTASAVKKFQKAYRIKATGEIDNDTWNKIEDVYEAIAGSGKVFVRNLKRGMSGEDVRYMKDCLYNIRYLKVKPTHNIFGKDTLSAVRSFQKDNNLKVDGIIGKNTWNAIVKESTEKDDIISEKEYPHISAKNRIAINKDLKNITDARIDIVKEVLKYAYDMDKGGDCIALYVFGEDLYDTNLKLNIATVASIEKAAKKNPKYFTNGRKEWMIEQVKKNPNMAESDCSGMEVGYLRKFKYVKNTFDATANGLCSKAHAAKMVKANMEPGAWCHKDGHIGTYVGGGLVVEFMGGAYGCQLSNLDNRVGYNFIKGKKESMSVWTSFWNPKYY